MNLIICTLVVQKIKKWMRKNKMMMMIMLQIDQMIMMMKKKMKETMMMMIMLIILKMKRTMTLVIHLNLKSGKISQKKSNIKYYILINFFNTLLVRNSMKVKGIFL